MPIIEVDGLCKEFRLLTHRRGLLGAAMNLFSTEATVIRAVDRISFGVEAGEFVGYVGPNGAGKSTTIKMLSGILVPTSGRLVVGGLTPHKARKENARQIGVVFGQRTQLWWDLPPIEAFDLLGRMYSVEKSRLKERIEYFTELLELEDLLETPVRKLSLGQKMRCELAAAQLHDPDLLFLDEPTIGLDVVAKERVRGILRRINQERGTTILLTSHDLDDIERLCSRVMVIDHGRIIHDGTVASLKGHFGHVRELVVDLEEATDELSLPDGCLVSGTEGKRVHIEFDAEAIRAPRLIAHILESHPIRDLSLHERRIEDVVRRIYSSGR
jgi:ABC-2 type transport system ATP-binding protein